MISHRQERATEDTWMFPPADGWTFDQVQHLELPFDWDLVDGVIVVRGQTRFWHNRVRDRIARALEDACVAPYEVVVEQCILLDPYNTAKPDVIVFDPRGFGLLELDCVPAERVALAVEVVSPGSRQDDRVRKPAFFSEAGIACYWRVELEQNDSLAVHEYWRHDDTRSYVTAPVHPVHRDTLGTEVPFPVEMDLSALLKFNNPS
ncbi:hypothetical protein STSP_38920 [Streptomyces jeddahensis]|uniref:Putative restriction endonuclease domain-containing protein n=2 Tax=Streptomyces jeddahensis TaxID=1716141 RepID=A0A177HPL3_9ACTN|nr:hypothetical protein STSP_38920 [Streptomyces jeddahensis]